jgi:tagatose 6-phosphate kinase
MILCIAPSPAWDVTYHVDRFRENATNRATRVSARAGGKAVNTARVLHALGETVTVLAPVGGHTGELFAADLAASGTAVELVADEHETRRTSTIVSDQTGDATVVTESSRLTDWPALLAAADRLMAGATVVVAGGSLPEGAPASAFAELSRAAGRHGIPIVVDTSGPALRATFEGAPTLVKPNHLELTDVIEVTDPMRAAQQLSRSSGSAVVVSLGAAGMVLAAGEESWRACLPAPLQGNPTGAGDAAVAGFARGIAAGSGWAVMLRDAVAVAAAAVLSPYAGDLASCDHAALARSVVVTEVAPR